MSWEGSGAVIRLEQVHKVDGQRTVLDVDDLAVHAGEIVAVLGLAGSGKKELLDLLTGRSLPTAGTVRIAGLDPAAKGDRAEFGRRVGVLPAENALYERLSARANLAFHCRLRNLPPARADEVLREIGLADHAALLARNLPSGLARRLAFGRAILHRPSVLLLHDPLADCDANSSDLLARLIRRLSGEGAAVLILTGDAAGLASLCRPAYILDRGHLSAALPPAQVGQDDLPFKIPARQEGEIHLINPAQVLYASAEGGRTCLHTADGPIATHLTLSELEGRLVHHGFFRAHRGYLVNLQRVKMVVPYTRDSFSLVLDDPDGTEVPLSKAAARDLRDFIGY